MAFWKRQAKTEPDAGVLKPSSEGGPVAPVTDPWARFEALSAAAPSALTEAQLRLLAFGGLRTELNNGGFHQFFFNSAGDLATEALAACEDLGIGSLAELLRQALRLLDGRYTPDQVSRQLLLDELDNEDDFEPLDAAYYEVELKLDLDAHMRVLASRS